MRIMSVSPAIAHVDTGTPSTIHAMRGLNGTSNKKTREASRVETYQGATTATMLKTVKKPPLKVAPQQLTMFVTQTLG